MPSAPIILRYQRFDVIQYERGESYRRERSSCDLREERHVVGAEGVESGGFNHTLNRLSTYYSYLQKMRGPFE